MDEAVLADRVIVMDKGSILTEGTPEEVFSQVTLMKKYGLDVPQSTELAYKLMGAGVKVSKMPLNVTQCVELLEEVLK
jgi:energy-coupling factor transport system ATP-binding protein